MHAMLNSMVCGNPLRRMSQRSKLFTFSLWFVHVLVNCLRSPLFLCMYSFDLHGHGYISIGYFLETETIFEALLRVS